jgi:hypothetical protein
MYIYIYIHTYIHIIFHYISSITWYLGEWHQYTNIIQTSSKNPEGALANLGIQTLQWAGSLDWQPEKQQELRDFGVNMWDAPPTLRCLKYMGPDH